MCHDNGQQNWGGRKVNTNLNGSSWYNPTDIKLSSLRTVKVNLKFIFFKFLRYFIEHYYRNKKNLKNHIYTITAVGEVSEPKTFPSSAYNWFHKVSESRTNTQTFFFKKNDADVKKLTITKKCRINQYVGRN
ncbi:hypothetical protein L6164_018632 [Bauhinia variegata]|uniref:Uncharacterized protein n=1 Tax=Bauhinia variegata TaxID=167791 RepID=A0ACB9NCJ1_BAUVA|nr:hypothetical protein L6164_018632 [Bauhinia variegata]